jgi:flagellar hook-associated protein 1 FlgK
MLNTINVASSGLSASQEQVENVMNNISNENTPGYKKRVVNISEASHIDARLTGRGVLIDDTTRITNIYMYDNLTSQKSKQSQYDELSTMLSDIEAIFYETEDSGFSADLDRYFQSIENLRTNPNNEIYKNDLRNTGTAIVSDLKMLYSNIEQRETITKNTIDDSVEELNSILDDIGVVNKTLTNMTNPSNDLLDKRDQLEQEIANYIDIQISRETSYELKITDVSAVKFDNNIHKVNVVKEYTSQQDVYSDFGNLGSSTIGKVVKINLNNTTSVELTLTDPLTTSIAQQIHDKINSTSDIKNDITATIVNGNLVVTSNTTGDKGKFDLDITNLDDKVVLSKDADLSVEGADDIHLEIFDRELTLTSGKLKSLVDNVDTTSDDNLFVQYKKKLDNFAKALSDMTGSFIQNSDDSYVYGTLAVDTDANRDNKTDIGLFNGSSVDTLKFNEELVGGLSQKKLDYLASLQWKSDIDIDKSGENLTSFSKYTQTLKVQIAEDKESVDFKKETQDAVTSSLQNSYDKLTKVDKDEEMMNLIKFQAAYEANAKLITMIDEMLATILGMKR